jgi:hypothetical protein
MSETRVPDAGAHQGAHALAEAEARLLAAERDPAMARPAAREALEALLRFWAQAPRGESLSALLGQVAETDPTLAEFAAQAATLESATPGPESYELAKIFVDAARGRLANI